MTNTLSPSPCSHDVARPATLPWPPLLALATASFITILTEALPAGMLPQISTGLAVSEALAGQLVTAYAAGSLLAAIPLTLLTQGLPRRALLISAIAGFALANLVTALSPRYDVTLLARFVAGIAAGLVWALLAGYAARLAPPSLKGRAIAVAMAGTPLALSIGIPAGAAIGVSVGWRATFALLSVISVVLIGWIRFGVPDFAGQRLEARTSLSAVLTIPGVAAVLGALLAYVIAHNVLYTYIGPLLAAKDMGAWLSLALLMFGVSSLGGIWLTGLFIDGHLRRLALASIGGFVVAVVVMMFAPPAFGPIAAILIWGGAFGGAATLFQTALSQAAGSATDVAQSMLVTSWNLAIAGGGLVGGLILDGMGTGGFGPVVLGLLAASFAIAFRSRRHGFPPARP